MSWLNLKWMVMTLCIWQTTQCSGLQTFTSTTSRASISGDAQKNLKRNDFTVREVLKKTSHLGARQNGSHVDLSYNLEAEIEVICIPGGYFLNISCNIFFSKFFLNFCRNFFCQYLCQHSLLKFLSITSSQNLTSSRSTDIPAM